MFRRTNNGKFEQKILPDIKERFVEIILERPNSFNWIKEILNEFQSIFSFRGQNDINWALITKVERAYQKLNNRDKYDIHSFEKNIINSFKQKYEEQLKQVDFHSILAYMQHYGLSTRLLDFSKDFLIALFFALEPDFKSKSHAQDSVVWGIRNIDINSNINLEVIGNQLFDADGINDYLVDSIKGEIEKRMVRFVSPKIQNPRIKIQKGCFICPSNLNADFESNFFGAFELDKRDLHKWSITLNNTNQNEIIRNKVGSCFILKIIISHKIKNNLIQYLKSIGYTHNYFYLKESTLKDSISKLAFKI